MTNAPVTFTPDDTLNYTNVAGTVSVTVNGLPPALGATTVSNVMATTAYLGGSVTATNGYPVSERGIYWGTNSGTVLIDGTKYSESGTFDAGAFSFFVTNLPAGRTNYFLAYAVNVAGTTNTAESSFLTRPAAPVVSAASNGTVNTFWANWLASGSATNYWLDVAPTNDFSVYLDGYSNLVVGAALTFSVTGLQAQTEYYYRVRAENGAGIGDDSATQTVTAAAMALSPASLAYTVTHGGADPAAQSFVLANSGDLGLNFTNTVSYSVGATGWWTPSPVTGSVDGLAGISITGSVTSAGMDVGTYYATNTVSSPDTTNAPQILVVTLTVNAPALSISVSPTSWAVGIVATGTNRISTPDSKISVTNDGNVTETFTLQISSQDNQSPPTNWTASASSAGAGDKVYVLSGIFCAQTDAPVAGSFNQTIYNDVLTTNEVDATSNMFAYAEGTTNGVAVPETVGRSLWLRFDSPTAGAGGIEHQITIQVGCKQP
jgi:hypothetical protein